jgi:hypothetical protein
LSASIIYSLVPFWCFDAKGGEECRVSRNNIEWHKPSFILFGSYVACVHLRFHLPFYLSNSLNLIFVCGQVCILNYVLGYYYMLAYHFSYPCYYLVYVMHCS